jgi:hypothetical protein
MRLRRSVLPLLLSSAALFVSACGPDCQSSCDKLFGDKSDECNIVVPGRSDDAGRQDLRNECVSHCQQALARNGDVGDYSPDERSSSADEVVLENEKQAALWMDCVAETSCEDLNSNYCAPTTNFP